MGRRDSADGAAGCASVTAERARSAGLPRPRDRPPSPSAPDSASTSQSSSSLARSARPRDRARRRHRLFRAGVLLRALLEASRRARASSTSSGSAPGLGRTAGELETVNLRAWLREEAREMGEGLDVCEWTVLHSKASVHNAASRLKTGPETRAPGTGGDQVVESVSVATSLELPENEPDAPPQADDIAVGERTGRGDARPLHRTCRSCCPGPQSSRARFRSITRA